MKSPIAICTWLLCCYFMACQTASYKSNKNWQVSLSPYLIKDSSLYGYFDISPEGIRLYASPMDKRIGKVECQLYPDEYEIMRQLFARISSDSLLSMYRNKGTQRWNVDSLYQPVFPQTTFIYGQDALLPLKGLRVALDPGHVAIDAEEGEVEGKYVKMRASPQTRMKSIRFNEANLTLTTAYLIKDELEALGATVLLSRTEAGKGARGMSYQEWYIFEKENSLQEEQTAGRMSAEDAIWWRTKAKEVDLYRRLFTLQDLRYRAQKINAFKPHLTLIIHYNIDSENWERRDANGFFPPTGANYCMAFVPGSFMRGELGRVEDRLSFLRLILTQDIARSVQLSEYFVLASQRLTGVPIIARDNSLSYLKNACILAKSKGVYARNLTLTNLIQGPLCYGESLCQDNIVEAQALNTRDITVAGIPTSSRVQEIAKAYIRAVLRFAREEFQTISF